MENRIDAIRKEADKGCATAQYNYAKLLLYGKGVRKNKKLAIELLEKAINQGYLKAKYFLGLLEHNSRDTFEQGYQRILETADAGLMEAQETIADIFYHFRKKGNFDLAYKYYKMAGDQGSVTADISLAQLLYDTRYYEEVKKASKKNTAQVKTSINEDMSIYLKRVCELRTKEDILIYLRRASERGSQKAQLMLANTLFTGAETIEKDEKEAVKWYKILAENNEGYSQLTLGKVYYEGEIVEMDIEKSFQYLTLASKNKALDAEFRQEAKELLAKLF
ncbi:tetratricopeptide repeat protein [Aliarcobacter cryaerophilus]|uniref:tetratricopeptide repeat protein n=1 Tax=Aliarcobacter cryaerophilus TaxID=28198 RepID=UPI0021B4B918|nr:tetratricopeptide repeat protein [Aliarcobacter cryaerophilus]MCT7510971.1 sel1 repeat family protein [Aliarcobacter cryaerophilus]